MDLSPYIVVVDHCAYAFAHRDSYLMFCAEMEKRGVQIQSHQGGIHQSCEAGVADYEQNCRGKEWAKAIDEAEAWHGRSYSFRTGQPIEF